MFSLNNFFTKYMHMKCIYKQYRIENLHAYIGKGFWQQVLNNLDTAIARKVLQ